MSDYKETYREIVEAIDGVKSALQRGPRGLDRATLRDQLAMAALTGILAGRPTALSELYPNEQLASAAYSLADAMIAEREKKP
jgi:hypothetical protein